MTGEGLVRLGELRRRQGRLDEAMALFERGGSHPLASLGRASVTFDRGDFNAPRTSPSGICGGFPRRIEPRGPPRWN